MTPALLRRTPDTRAAGRPRSEAAAPRPRSGNGRPSDPCCSNAAGNAESSDRGPDPPRGSARRTPAPNPADRPGLPVWPARPWALLSRPPRCPHGPSWISPVSCGSHRGSVGGLTTPPPTAGHTAGRTVAASAHRQWCERSRGAPELRPPPGVVRPSWVGRLLDAYLAEAVGGEGVDLFPFEWPGRAVDLRVGFNVTGRDDDERAARGDHPPHVDDGGTSGRVGQRLEGEDVDDQVEGCPPVRWRVQQVGGEVVHAGPRVPLSGHADGGLGDVERHGGVPEPGDVLGVGTQATADDDRPPPAPSQPAGL